MKLLPIGITNYGEDIPWLSLYSIHNIWRKHTLIKTSSCARNEYVIKKNNRKSINIKERKNQKNKSYASDEKHSNYPFTPSSHHQT